MGLDTSHNCWHGAYSSFKQFRDDVLDAATSQYGYKPDYAAHPGRAFMGWWDDDHKYGDILDVFFVHSDCEGYIFPSESELLADRLEGLIDAVDTDAAHPFPQFGSRARLRAFIDGLRAAADEWQIVVFH